MTNVELKYHVKATAKNGTAQRIKTPFDITFADIQQIFIEQTDHNAKRLSIYPNGLIVYFEQTSTNITIRTNWPIENDSDGDLVIIEPK